MSSPKISVLMSVFNNDEFLKEAIDSILNQTFTDFEFIIIDDASTDQTYSILKAYKDPRIIILKNNSNLGLAASLNAAIQIARGEYLARQDADDISNIHRFERQVKYLDQHDEVGVLGATTEWIDKDNKSLLVWQQPTDNPHIQQTLLVYCCIIHGSVMCRTDVIREAKGYNLKMREGQDYDLWLRISETIDIACLPQVLYFYRRHSGMASNLFKEEQNKNAHDALINALYRRDFYARKVLRFNRELLPDSHSKLNRRKLSQRFVWWSSGARYVSKSIASRFLVYAVLLDPTTPDIWEFLREVIQNKIHKLIKPLHVN
jgi:glycosyltransferase involved in cell wall biosynthesis